MKAILFIMSLQPIALICTMLQINLFESLTSLENKV